MMTLAGQTIGGKYRIIRLLGSGNFGNTYLVEPIDSPNCQFALKQFSFVSNNSEAFNKAKELFAREAQTLQQLGMHDRIPALLDYIESDQAIYLVQEFIDGNPLSDELQPGTKLPSEKVIELLQEVLEILQVVHNQMMIHRDIKPNNIMRRASDRKLVLIDFGAVKVAATQLTTIQAQSNLTPTQIYTQGYAPKEQMLGNPQFNSDIYALGMTAIQALTGTEPGNLKKNHRTGNVKWQDKAQVDKQLASILDKMVQDNCDLRYRCVEDVLSDLTQVQKTQVMIRTNTSLQPTRLKGSISSFMVFLLLAPLVAVAAVVLSFFATRPILEPAEKIPTSSPEPTPSSEPTPSLEPTPPPSSISNQPIPQPQPETRLSPEPTDSMFKDGR